MPIDQTAPGFSRYADRNHALRLLAKMKRVPDGRLVAPLAEVICEPMSIEDTNSFASLLVKIESEAFIAPLIKAIVRAVPNESLWLADYMYALIELLTNREDFYPVEEDFVHLLGGWLLSTGGGEISWKAGHIMAEVRNPATRDYLIRGASDGSLFHETRIACIGGIVNHFPEDSEHVLTMAANDPDKWIRDTGASAKVQFEERDGQI